MTELKKWSSAELRSVSLELITAMDAVEKEDSEKGLAEAIDMVEKELYRRAYSAIFKVCCKVLKNHGCNQFQIAADYAKKVVNSSDFETSATHWEISWTQTKRGVGTIIVEL